MENKTYSSKLIELRKKKGMSRAKVANEIGVSRSAVAMYERGERVPKDDIKVKLAKFYNKSIAFIFYS